MHAQSWYAWDVEPRCSTCGSGTREEGRLGNWWKVQWCFTWWEIECVYNLRYTALFSLFQTLEMRPCIQDTLLRIKYLFQQSTQSVQYWPWPRLVQILFDTMFLKILSTLNKKRARHMINAWCKNNEYNQEWVHNALKSPKCTLQLSSLQRRRQICKSGRGWDVVKCVYANIWIFSLQNTMYSNIIGYNEPQKLRGGDSAFHYDPS